MPFDISLLWLIVGGYFFVFVCFLFFHIVQRRKHRKLLHDFEWAIDEWMYLYAKAMYHHRDEIYAYEKKNREVLYANKHMIMKDNERSYVTHYHLLRDDMDYVDTLLAEDIVSEKDFARVDTLHAQVQKKETAYRRVGTLLKTMTLGLYYIREVPLLR